MAGHSKTTHAHSGALSIRTERRTQLFELTAGVRKLVQDSGVTDGICHLYVPHTTAGITINENADPDVASDFEKGMDRLVPQEASYRHSEGNSDAHIKAALIGQSVTVFVAGGQMELGQWQGIFFCEFDGPRRRQVKLRIVPDPS